MTTPFLDRKREVRGVFEEFLRKELVRYNENNRLEMRIEDVLVVTSRNRATFQFRLVLGKHSILESDYVTELELYAYDKTAERCLLRMLGKAVASMLAWRSNSLAVGDEDWAQ